MSPTVRPSWILPDGCIDVLWNGRELTVAGPDTTPNLANAPTGTRYTALRFASGVAPTVLGMASVAAQMGSSVP